MNVDLERKDLLRLFLGLPIPYGGNEYTEFTGSQWNEDWGWSLEKLADLSDMELWGLYKSHDWG